MTTDKLDIIKIIPSRAELAQCVKTNLKCPISGCDKVLPQPSALKFHVVKAHKIVKSETDRKIANSKPLAEQKSESPVYRYHCPNEGCPFSDSQRSFSSMKLLRQHYMKVHGEKKFNCEKCGYQFSLERDCRRHQTDCGLTNCTCGIELSSKASLLAHCKKFNHAIPARFARMMGATKSTKDRKESTTKTGAVTLLPKPKVFFIPAQNTDSATPGSSAGTTWPVIMIADCRPIPLAQKYVAIRPKLTEDERKRACSAIERDSNSEIGVTRDQDTQTDILSYLVSTKPKSKPSRPSSACISESSTISTQTSAMNQVRSAAQTQTPGDMILCQAMETAEIPVHKQSTGCQVSPRGKSKKRHYSEMQTQTTVSPPKRRKRKSKKASAGARAAVASTATMSSNTDATMWSSVSVQSASVMTDPDSYASPWNPLCDNETQTMALLEELDATLAESISTQTFESYLADSTGAVQSPVHAHDGSGLNVNSHMIDTCTQHTFMNTSSTLMKSISCSSGLNSPMCDMHVGLAHDLTAVGTTAHSVSQACQSLSPHHTSSIPAASAAGDTQSAAGSTSVRGRHESAGTDPLFGGDFFSIGINTQADDFLAEHRKASTVETQTSQELSFPEIFTTSASQTTGDDMTSQTHTETQTMDEVFQQLFTNMETQTTGTDLFMPDFSFADIDTQTNISLNTTSTGNHPPGVEGQFNLADIETQTGPDAAELELSYLNTVQTQTASDMAGGLEGRQINSETQTLLYHFDDIGGPGLQDSHTQTTWEELESIMNNLA